MEILKVENITKSYGKGEAKVDAIKNINLSINKGEFVAIVGPSGSGKSTLLHLLGGVDKPTSGKVYINDVEQISGSSAVDFDKAVSYKLVSSVDGANEMEVVSTVNVMVTLK